MIQPSPGAADNHKEREHQPNYRDRDKDREKRLSVPQVSTKEPSPLEHRDNIASVDTKG